jgi:hypothetical protein
VVPAVDGWLRDRGRDCLSAAPSALGGTPEFPELSGLQAVHHQKRRSAWSRHEPKRPPLLDRAIDPSWGPTGGRIPRRRAGDRAVRPDALCGATCPRAPFPARCSFFAAVCTAVFVKSRISNFALGCAKSATLRNNSCRYRWISRVSIPLGTDLTAHFRCTTPLPTGPEGWALRASMRPLGPADHRPPLSSRRGLMSRSAHPPSVDQPD